MNEEANSKKKMHTDPPDQATGKPITTPDHVLAFVQEAAATAHDYTLMATSPWRRGHRNEACKPCLCKSSYCPPMHPIITPPPPWRGEDEDGEASFAHGDADATASCVA